jgi:hypothetical protein
MSKSLPGRLDREQAPVPKRDLTKSIVDCQ